MRLAIGFLLAVFVGVGCRWFSVPLPGPPAILGAAMAVAMATGYTLADQCLARRGVPPPTATGAVSTAAGQQVKQP